MADRVVKITLSADIAQYKQAMEDAAQAAKKAKDDSSKASKDEAKASAEAAKAAREKLDAWRSLGTTLTVVGGAMTALTVSVIKTGVEYNTLQQTSRAALTTLLGGAQQANAQMDKLDAFARTSPFAKTTFITAQQQMLAFGIESKKVIPYLDAIQEAVAAAGGSNQQLGEIAFIMAQISSAGKITAQDLMQFGQRGVNAAELIGSQMGKTGAEIRAQITAGTLGADQALDALAAGMKEKFDGASANVKLTFAGALDRVKAAWRDLSADLTKPLVGQSGGGLFVDLLNRLADVLRMFQALPEPVKLAGGALFALVGIVTTVSGAVIIGRLKWLEFATQLDKLGPMGARVKSILGGVGSFLAGPWGVALAGAGVALMIFMQHQAEAKARVDAFAAALRAGTKATEEYVAQQLAANYSFAGFDLGSAIDDAKKLGIATEDLTAATSMSEAEYKKFVARVEDAGNASADASDSAHRLISTTNQLREDNKAAEKQNKNTKEAQDAFNKSLDDGADATGEVTDKLKEQEDASKKLVDALQGVIDAYEGLAHGGMDVGAAHDKALDSINKMKEAAENATKETEHGTEVIEAERVTIEGVNSASVKFRDSMRDVEQAHYDSAKAIAENGGSIVDATAEWQRGRDAVIDMLKAKGLDEAAARTWADKNLGSAKDVELGLAAVKDKADALPDKKTIKLETEGENVLAQRLANLKEQLSSIPNVKRITLESYTVGSRTVSAPGQAEGGPVVGPGAKGVDSELRMLAPGEHVLTAADVDAAGGHAAILNWRRSLHGATPGMASGGPVKTLVRAGSSMQPQVNVAAPSIVGAQLSGTLDLGNGLTGMIQAVVVESQQAAAVPFKRGRR